MYGNKGTMLAILEEAVQKAPEKLKVTEFTTSEADKNPTEEFFSEKEDHLVNWGLA